MIAAFFLVALSLWVMIESLLLKNPGSFSTAPGLLPFFTAASLGAMALSLGYLAVQRRRLPAVQADATEKSEHLRALLLFGFIGFYLLCLQLVSFEYSFQIAGVRLGYGSFEVLTILALTLILSVFWKRTLLLCFLVSAAWITLLAGAFRYVFVIPLPGSI
ncbi:MAG: hypothetical protein ACC631_00315 [Halocynthiibacter sp.]